MTDQRAGAGAAESVRPLELFFDLVFVFTITQVASVLAALPTLLGLARVTVLLGIIWWMYAGAGIANPHPGQTAPRRPGP